MNGPEHYAEAERLIELADRYVSESWPTETGERKADILAAAQVHATLALAAATTLHTLRSPRTSETWRTTALGEPAEVTE